MAELSTPTRNRFLLWLSICLLAAFALRFSLVSEPSIRDTEAMNWALITGMAQSERSLQPPLFPLMLKGWSALFGQGLAAMRTLSLIGGLFTVLFAGLLGRRLGGDRFGLYLAWLFCAHPLLTLYSATADSFIWLIAATMAVLYLFEAFLDNEEPDPLKASFLMAACIAGIFLHFHFLQIVAFLLAYSLIFRRGKWEMAGFRRQFFLLFGLCVGALLMYSPFIIEKVHLFFKMQESFASSLHNPGQLMIPWLIDTGYGAAVTVVDWIPPVMLFAGIGLGFFGAVTLLRSKLHIDPMIYFLFVFMALLSVFVTVLFPFFNDRTVWFWIPGMLLFICLGLVMIPLRAVRIILLGVFLAFGIGGTILTSALTYAEKASMSTAGYYAWKKPADWKGITGKVAMEIGKKDQIVFEPSWASPRFLYHAKDLTEFKDRYEGDIELLLLPPQNGQGAKDLNIFQTTKRLFYVFDGFGNKNKTFDQLKDLGFTAKESEYFMGPELTILNREEKSAPESPAALPPF